LDLSVQFSNSISVIFLVLQLGETAMTGTRFTGNIQDPVIPFLFDIPGTAIDLQRPLIVTLYPNANLDVQLDLLGNGASIVGGPINTFTGGTPESTTNGPQPGVSYRAVVQTAAVPVPATATTGPFLLEINSENAANNVAATAPQLGNLTPQSINGFVGRSDINDWYNFRLPSAGTVSLRLSGLQDNADLELYEANGTTLILRSQNGGTSDEALENVNLAAGNYLVKVSANDTTANLPDGGRASTSYTLNLIPGGAVPGTTVTLSASGTPSEAGGGLGTFTLSRGSQTTGDLTVNLTFGGTATFGGATSDYGVIGANFAPTGTGTVTIPNGQSVVNFTVSPVDDALNDPNETIAVSLNPGTGYNVGTPNSASLTIADNDGGGTDPVTGLRVYRFYNTVTGTHFYTADENERNFVRDNLIGYNYEGPSFEAAPAGTPNTAPVFRFFNTQVGTHFYTIDPNEANFVRTNLMAFRDEGIAYNAYVQPAPGSDPLYRFFNTFTGAHFYTPSAVERDVVSNTLPFYRYEGVGYYVDV